MLDALAKQRAMTSKPHQLLERLRDGLEGGIHHSWKHRERIAGLALFATTQGDELTDLDAYLDGWVKTRTIYYITGESAGAGCLAACRGFDRCGT